MRFIYKSSWHLALLANGLLFNVINNYKFKNMPTELFFLVSFVSYFPYMNITIQNIYTVWLQARIKNEDRNVKIF